MSRKKMQEFREYGPGARGVLQGYRKEIKCRI